MSKKIIVSIIVVILAMSALTYAYIYSQRSNALKEVVVEPEPSALPIASPLVSNTTVEAFDLVVSDQVGGAAATLLDNRVNLPVSAPVVYVTVKLPDTTETKDVAMQLLYNGDDSKLGPVSSTVKRENGQVYAGFRLTQPTKGWPDGPYTLDVVLNTGESKQVTIIFQ